ncbi:MAG: hypothetical protein K6T31_01305 [Alicyclobacillus sp.]|nr:hypothetical protein [Alicyclobacillus sp.]
MWGFALVFSLLVGIWQSCRLHRGDAREFLTVWGLVLFSLALVAWGQLPVHWRVSLLTPLDLAFSPMTRWLYQIL